MQPESPGESIQAPAVDYSRLDGTIFAPQRVSQLNAVVVGAGALGNEVVRALGLLGAARVLVIDHDAVEPSNLTRSLFFRAQDAIGRNKALAIVESAERLFPDTRWTAIPREVAGVGFQDIAEAHLLFGCVDSDLARLEIAYIVTKLNVPQVDGGLGGSSYSRGRVTVFPGRDAACFCCLLTEGRRRELLTRWESESHPCWIEPAGPHAPAYPSTPTMSAIVGAMQVEIGLRWLYEGRRDPPSVAWSAEVDLSQAQPKMETIGLALSSFCPFHDAADTMLPSPGPSDRVTVVDLIQSAEATSARRAALVLDWPICTRARCAACGHTWAPMRRLAALRESGVCPGCASVNIRPEQVIREVERTSAWAASTLAQLDLPDRHLHTFRFW
ncbi:MAG: ThiF family adenylyltransferase [Acidobacteriota bacterium]